MHQHGKNEGRGQQKLDAELFVQWLVNANLFVIPLDNQGYWFRYHHLFQAFLQNMLRKQTGADRIAELHLIASNWFAGNGLIDEAIQHALAAGDNQVAVKLVIDNRYDLLNNSDFPRLSRWLRSLPEDAVGMEPLLMTTKAFVGLFYGPESDRYVFTEKARRVVDVLPQESEVSKMLRGEIAAMQGALDILFGHRDGAFDNGTSALSFLPKHAYFARTMAVCAIAAGHQMAGDHGRCVKELKKMLTEPGLPVGERVKVWLYLCILCHMAADTSGALSAGHECLRIARKGRFTIPSNNARYHLGAIHYLRNELADAKSFLNDIMRDCAVSESKHLLHASGILAFIHLSEGRVEDATRIVESTSDNIQIQDSYALATRDALLVELALRRGAVDEARGLSTGINFDLRPPHWFLYTPQLTPLKLLLAEGTDRGVNEARDRLSQLEEAMSRIHRRHVCLDVLALEALAYRKLGDEPTALAKLRAALDIAEPGGWVRNFVDLGAPMRDLLERLNQVQPGHTYSQLALEACRAEARSDLFLDSNGKEALGLAGQVLGLEVSTSETAPAPDVAPQPLKEPLTNRELDIVELLARRLQNKEIAEKLSISPATVKTHLQNIYQKLSAESRRQAVENAEALGILSRH
jgi:LuxR family maltose regulon positive regulatory protein